MNKPIDTLIGELIAKGICYLIGHAFLSTGHNQRRCNRCEHSEIKSSITSYRWAHYVPETKEFNPID